MSPFLYGRLPPPFLVARFAEVVCAPAAPPLICTSWRAASALTLPLFAAAGGTELPLFVAAGGAELPGGSCTSGDGILFSVGALPALAASRLSGEEEEEEAEEWFVSLPRRFDIRLFPSSNRLFPPPKGSAWDGNKEEIDGII